MTPTSSIPTHRYPNTLRDLLIRIAQSGTVQAKWTNAILDEMTADLRRNRPDRGQGSYRPGVTPH